MQKPIENLGERCLDAVEQAGALAVFFSVTLARIATPPYRPAAVVRQVYFIGARSLPVIAISGGFIGMVVALQFHDTLVRFGSVGLLGSAVGLSLVRELGPVLTALMVIARAGSATCAEISIMRVDNQIDALECMGIDPYRHLIAPKLAAGLVSVPLLTAVFIVIGIAGGYLVGVVLFGVGSGAYFEGMYDTVGGRDLAMGFVKAVAFGLIIFWICAGAGFFLDQVRLKAFGAEGVSRTTTNAVVLAAVLVLFTDYLVSSLMV